MFSQPKAAKSLAAYVLLVGVPLAGLVAILRAGGRLHAPPSIAGEWRVQGGPFAIDPDSRVLTVVQSGDHVEVELGTLSLRGRFTGDSLDAERRGMNDGSFGPCPPHVRLRARVDTAARPRRLVGLIGGQAPGCPQLAIDAVHTPSAAEGR
jgi:hypothetical protein